MTWRNSYKRISHIELIDLVWKIDLRDDLHDILVGVASAGSNDLNNCTNVGINGNL